MFRCLECGTSLDNPLNQKVVDCPACGTEFEIFDGNLFGLYLGPSEE